MTCSLVLVRKEEGKKGPNVQPLSLRRRRPYRDRGGRSRGTNLLWEINGTEGDLQVTADGGQAQIFELTVRGGNGAQSSLEALPAPQGPSTNVARAYARFASASNARVIFLASPRGVRFGVPFHCLSAADDPRRLRQPTFEVDRSAKQSASKKANR